MLAQREVLHARAIFPATQLACNHHQRDGSCNRMRGHCDAAQHAAAPHRMATGPEGDAYYEVGERYRAALARENVEVQLVPTAGSVENLTKLLDPRSGGSGGPIEGGLTPAGVASALESLGTVFYEPLWWFHKREITGEGVDALRGRKVSIGPEGSGTRALSP